VVIVKIDPSKISDLYEAYARYSSNANSGVNKESELSKDRVEISDVGMGASSIASLRTRIVSEIETGADEQRLLELKNSIKNGTYYVSNEDIAGAMLNASINDD
jgi:anti-sigma28 factor (negative regulator of flagellin synthesis)